MQMEKGLDTGPMLLKRELSIDRKNAGQLTEELAKIGAVAMVEWLADPTRYPPARQPEAGVTTAAKIDKAEARIDWAQRATAIERQVRALAPTPGAWFEAQGERIKLLSADVVDATAAPGTILDDQLTIACGTAALRPLCVQRAGRAAMTAAELLRGFPLPPGTVLL
jgi:methionyl-tRNA formyltransferase